MWVPHSVAPSELYAQIDPIYSENIAAMKARMVPLAGEVALAIQWTPEDLKTFRGRKLSTEDKAALVATRVLGLPLELRSLDWYPCTTGESTGNPRWLRDYLKDPKLTNRVATIILGCQYLGKPIHWDSKGFWATNDGPVPHPDDPKAHATQMFTKGFCKSESVTSANPIAQEILTANMSWATWLSMRSRYAETHHESPEGFPVVLPQIVSTGTATRRCADKVYQVMPNPKKGKPGTEFKATIAAPAGYKIVGADIDSEELWLAGLLGDQAYGYMGSTPLSRMCILGSKALGTDPHSVLAKEAGISRDAAKTIWYGLIYGLGEKGTIDALTLNVTRDPEDTQEAHTARIHAMALKVIRTAKGDKDYGLYSGGLASATFNRIREISNGVSPKSPVLKASISKALMGIRDYATTRGNWVVQTTGVDFRDILVVLMGHFMQVHNLDARLILTIHDEARYLVADADVSKFAYWLQMAHLYTRAAIVEAMGLPVLTAGTSFFSEIDIDQVLRKSPKDPCVTPTQLEQIAPGVSLTPGEVFTRYCPSEDALQGALNQKPV
jgi:DNA polymerase gamma 1